MLRREKSWDVKIRCVVVRRCSVRAWFMNMSLKITTKEDVTESEDDTRDRVWSENLQDVKHTQCNASFIDARLPVGVKRLLNKPLRENQSTFLLHRPFNICSGFPMYILDTRSPNWLTLLKTWSKLIISIADMSWRAYWGGLEHYDNTVVCSDGAGEGLFYRCSLMTVKPSYWTVLRPPAVSGLRSQLPLFGVRLRSCMPSRLHCNNSLACTVFILNPTIHSRCQTALLMFCSAIRVSVRLLSVCLVMSPTINDAVVQLLPLRHVWEWFSFFRRLRVKKKKKCFNESPERRKQLSERRVLWHECQHRRDNTLAMTMFSRGTVYHDHHLSLVRQRANICELALNRYIWGWWWMVLVLQSQANYSPN